MPSSAAEFNLHGDSCRMTSLTITERVQALADISRSGYTLSLQRDSCTDCKSTK